MGNRRTSARHRIHLSVRYSVATEFVREYAENLSHGGLFVTGTGLAPLQEVEVEIELPGAGRLRVTAEVAHIVTEEAAVAIGHRPGAGLAITSSPPGFKDALTSYLHRLGRRADKLVMTSHEGIAKLMRDAGYRVAQAPPPQALVEAIATGEEEVIAVVVASSQRVEYAEVARRAGAGDVVLSMDSHAELDAILTLIDNML